MEKIFADLRTTALSDLPRRIPFLWKIGVLTTLLWSLVHAYFACFSPDAGTLDYIIHIISARRVVRGEVPYRDFQVLYGPLGHYAAAIFQWPLRSTPPLFSAQCYTFACVVVLYLLLARGLSRFYILRWFFVVGALVTFLATSDLVARGAFYSLPMMMPLIAVIFLLPRTVEAEGSPRHRTWLWQAVCGTLTAIEFLTRINFGVYLVIAIVMVGAAAFFFGNRIVARATLGTLVAAAVATVLLFAILAMAGIAGPAIADMRQYLPRATAGRALPWKYNFRKIPSIYAIVSVLLTLLGAAGRLRRRDIDFWLVPYLLLCAFLTYSLFRYGRDHFYPVLVISLILLLCPFPDSESARVVPQTRLTYRPGLLELQLLVLVVATWQLGPIYPISSITAAMRHLNQFPMDNKIIRHGLVIREEEGEMLDHLDRLKRPGDEVFWANAAGSCQSTFDWCVNLGLYLADDMLPQQRIWFFDTGSTPYEDVQQTIIADLESRKTPWIGLEDVYCRDERGIAHPESPLFTDYVKAHYTLVFTTFIPGLNTTYGMYARRTAD